MELLGRLRAHEDQFYESALGDDGRLRPLLENVAFGQILVDDTFLIKAMDVNGFTLNLHVLILP